MKKLMIAACAIAFAAVAQAAQMDWGVDYSYDYNGNGDTEMGGRGTDTPYLVYLFDTATYSQEKLLAAIDAGTYKTDWAANKVAHDSITGNAASDGNLNVYIDSANLTVTDNKANAYLVIFNAGDIDSADHVYITAATEAVVPTSGTAGTFNWDGTRDLVDMNGPANWTAVPEPTSGLLLLIGVAGLALKRKRA